MPAVIKRPPQKTETSPKLIKVQRTEPQSEVQQIPPTYYVIRTVPVVSTIPNATGAVAPAADLGPQPPASESVQDIDPPKPTRANVKTHRPRQRRGRSPYAPRTRKLASKPFSQLGDRQKQRVKKEFDIMLKAFCERHKIEDKSELCDKYCPTKLQKKLTADETHQLQTKLKFSGKTMNKLRSILNGHGCNVFASKRAVKIIEDRILQEHAGIHEAGEIDIDEHIEVDGDTSGEMDVDVEEEIEVDETPDLEYDEDGHVYAEEGDDDENVTHEYDVNTSDEYIETPADYVDVSQVHQ